MADKKKMSMEDILAACRTSDGDEGGGTAPQANESESAVDSPASKPAKPAAPAKKAGELSVADILAAARGDGGQKPAAKPKTAAKTSPKTAAKAKTDTAKPAPASGPLDTSSILAAARGAAKPGPMSKAEAAAKGQPTGAKTKRSAPPMPAKPVYAQPKTAAPREDRRGFISIFLGSFLAVGFTTLAVTNLLWLAGLARFMFPNVLIEPPNQFKVGFPTDFSPGSVAEAFKAQFGVWIVNTEYEGEQQIVALKTVCTHLGCTPNWLEAEQKFKCPCHGSGFYKDGINFEGPAPRPLERYAIHKADDGQLEVDKSKTFQQEIGQWSDASSFFKV